MFCCDNDYRGTENREGKICNERKGKKSLRESKTRQDIYITKGVR